MFRTICLALALGLFSAPVQADIVVNYDVLAQSHDRALRRESDRRTVAAEMNRHIARLGERYLSAGQDLHILLTRFDLAGEYEPWRSGWEDVRILRDITPPRIHFTYTLFQDGKPIRRGKARLSDIDYLSDPRGRRNDSRLIHEKLLFDDWFRDSFGEQMQAAPRGGA